MSESYHELLKRLGEACGVLPYYWDIEGRQHVTSDETRRSFLEAMGFRCGSAEELSEALAAVERKTWVEPAEPVYLAAENENAHFVFSFPLPVQTSTWCLHIDLEAGGKVRKTFSPAHLFPLSERHFDGEVYKKYSVDLGQALPIGYHRLELYAEGAKKETVRRSLVVCSPRESYLPRELKAGRKVWGLSAQLYGLRSERNWGIGDFTDLQELVGYAAKQGADFIGLNPLHAISPRGDMGISPYSPSARFALNALYIDIDAAASLVGSEAAASLIAGQSFQEKLGKLRSSGFVEYAIIAELKFAALEAMFKDFKREHLEKASSLAVDFEEFLKRHNSRIAGYALFAAIQEHFAGADPRVFGWTQWPENFRNPGSSAVKNFAKKHKDRIDFYLFVEWLADVQLTAVAEACRTQGLLVGLYVDVALGAAMGGAGTWLDQDLYAFKASMGAPPDALAPQGQDWGLPPLDPHKVREAGYTPFISALRSSMRYAGALRLDHVMALMRLYWVPGPGKAREGSYVLYRLEDFMAIVRLESVRNKCLVIGEDLGTVPDEVRRSMHESKVLSYKVLYFMKDYSHGTFLPGNAYPAEALVVTSTHDLPTLRGWWEGRDLEIRNKLELHEPDVLRNLRSERARDRAALLKMLVQQGMLDQEEAEFIAASTTELSEVLLRQIHIFLGSTPCYLQVIQLEDLMRQLEQANLPGTTDEQPNWRRKLGFTLEELQRNAGIAGLVSAIRTARSAAR